MEGMTDYTKPGPDLVLRVQDDTVPGGPDSTLLVGIAAHIYQYLAEARGLATLSEVQNSLMTVQRWDQGVRRWRALVGTERDLFTDGLLRAYEARQEADQAEADDNLSP